MRSNRPQTANLIATALTFASVLAVIAPLNAQTPTPRPATQTPAATYQAMSSAERGTIQSDLAWVGDYNGTINGDFNDRSIAAVKKFQKRHGGKETGILNPHERETLTGEARKLQSHVGWKTIDDPVNGIRLGVPLKFAPQQGKGASGSTWSSAQGQVQIETWRVREPGLTIATLAQRELGKAPPPRQISYKAIRPDFFVLSGLQGLKKIYMRGQIQNGEIRGMTVLYDQATEGTMEPVVIAMSSAFNPFPAASAASNTPPPRRKVEYSTGIVVAPDAILAERQATEACQSLSITGHGNADRTAQDEKNELALLRLYGAQNLAPLTLGETSKALASGDVDLAGIADPQDQGGGHAASLTKSRIAMQGDDAMLNPAPSLAFSGAALIANDGKWIGMVRVKPTIVAGPANLATASQAFAVGPQIIAAFLASQSIKPVQAGSARDIKASLVRVICVRK